MATNLCLHRRLRHIADKPRQNNADMGIKGRPCPLFLALFRFFELVLIGHLTLPLGEAIYPCNEFGESIKAVRQIFLTILLAISFWLAPPSLHVGNEAAAFEAELARDSHHSSIDDGHAGADHAHDFGETDVCQNGSSHCTPGAPVVEIVGLYRLTVLQTLLGRHDDLSVGLHPLPILPPPELS